jgi:hypothetical protein
MSSVATLPIGTEVVDRRVLGAFRLVDSITGKTVTDGMTVTAAGLKIRANRSGVWAVLDAPGLTAATNDFAGTAAAPPAQKFVIQVSDPARYYLPRQATLTLPASLAPLGTGGIFTPQSVSVFAGPGASAGINWAKLRLSVVQAGTAQGLGYALVQVTNTATNVVLATGMTDLRGEALLAVAGLGVTASAAAGGAVMQKTTPVSIAAFFDTNNGDTASSTQPAGWLPDPDQMLLNLKGASVKSATQAAQLSPGTSQSFTLSIST